MCHLHERPLRGSHQKTVLWRSGFQTHYYYFVLLLLLLLLPRILLPSEIVCKTPTFITEIQADLLWMKLEWETQDSFQLSHLNQQALKLLLGVLGIENA